MIKKPENTWNKKKCMITVYYLNDEFSKSCEQTHQNVQEFYFSENSLYIKDDNGKETTYPSNIVEVVTIEDNNTFLF